MRALFVAAFAALMLAGCAQEAAVETPEAQIERGRYLVENVVLCNDCHTPMTPTGPDMAHSLQGATLVMGPLIDIPWAPQAPQIAGLPAHFTEEQFQHFIMTGERPDGSHPRPPMPPYRLNEADARAVTAYIKTLPRAEE